MPARPRILAALLLITGLVVVACSGSTPPEDPVAETPAPAPEAQPAATSPPTEDETPSRDDANTLRWSTASEVENFGYDIYRGPSEEGPFARINDEPVLGAGTTDAPSSYAYVDDTIDPYAVYYYYVESISLSGERERFTPVFKAGPKRVRDSAAE